MAGLLDRGGAELRHGGARRGYALGFVVAAEEGRRVQGVAGRFKGASAGISASAPEFGKPARFAGGRPVCARRLREEEDGPGAWGRAGSGKRETRRCERAVRAHWARAERRRAGGSGPSDHGAGRVRAGPRGPCGGGKRERGPGLGLVWAGVWGLAGFLF